MSDHFLSISGETGIFCDSVLVVRCLRCFAGSVIKKVMEKTHKMLGHVRSGNSEKSQGVSQ